MNTAPPKVIVSLLPVTLETLEAAKEDATDPAISVHLNCEWANPTLPHQIIATSAPSHYLGFTKK